MGKGKKPISQVVGDKTATVFGLWELFNDPHQLLEEIGVSNSRVYDDIPSGCYVCKHTKFSNLSLIGVYSKPLFYECEECGALHLRYNQEWLEAKMLGLKDAYINPLDWVDEPPRDEFN